MDVMKVNKNDDSMLDRQLEANAGRRVWASPGSRRHDGLRTNMFGCCSIPLGCSGNSGFARLWSQRVRWWIMIAGCAGEGGERALIGWQCALSRERGRIMAGSSGQDNSDVGGSGYMRRNDLDWDSVARDVSDSNGGDNDLMGLEIYESSANGLYFGHKLEGMSQVASPSLLSEP